MSDKPSAGDLGAMSFPRPLPQLEGDAAPYWQALAEGRIDLQRCRKCRRYVFYPRPFCPSCHARDLAWETVDGNGTVYACTIVHKPTNPWFFAHAPYVYAIVELPCGVRLPTRIVGCDPASARIGAPVEPVFERVDDAVTLLHFAPRG
jgi:uncharacterized OB-fold protein